MKLIHLRREKKNNFNRFNNVWLIFEDSLKIMIFHYSLSIWKRESNSYKRELIAQNLTKKIFFFVFLAEIFFSSSQLFWSFIKICGSVKIFENLTCLMSSMWLSLRFSSQWEANLEHNNKRDIFRIFFFASKNKQN